jgi:nitrogen regulatory protein PII
MVRPRKKQKVTEGLAQRKLPKYTVISNGKGQARSATAERSQESDAVITPKTQTRYTFPYSQ